MPTWYVCFIFLHYSVSLSDAKYAILPNEPLGENETLVSANGVFELGFFKNSVSENVFVGIWFKNLPEKKPVWVANRDNPLEQKYVFAIRFDGNLVVIDRRQAPTIVNSRNLASSSNTSAELLDNGNLILKQGDQIIWESFSFPTDTYLPGMKLGWFGLTSHEPRRQVLLSWLGPHNPSRGSLTVVAGLKDARILSVWRGDTAHVDIGSLDENGIFRFVFNDSFASFNLSHTSTPNETYLTYNTIGGYEFSWLVMASTGHFDEYRVMKGRLSIVRHSLCDEEITVNSSFCLDEVAPQIQKQSRKKRKLKLILIILIAPAIMAIVILWRYKRRQKHIRRVNQNRDDSSSRNGEVKLISDEAKNATTVDIPTIDYLEFSREEQNLTWFSISTIENATGNFDTENKLGEGGFGPVYKGNLPNGQEIAVKRLSKRSAQGVKEFKNEVTLISRVQHRNLVRLLGYCIQGEEEYILVYEYLPNRSLDSFIFDVHKQKLLNWKTRIKIIEGIAQGVLYLHKYSRLRIIHRDLKTSNILLDGDMNPKVSDFGMARIFGEENETRAKTTKIAGTYGYMSPEYAMDGHFSEKSDVFSFGIIVLEIISGKRNISFFESDHSLNLLGYAWKLWKEEKSNEFLDSTLANSCTIIEAAQYVQLGLLCVQERAADRPTMLDVVTMVRTDASASLPQPKEPAFLS
ncbi:hypothetical protein ABFX02_01G032200 [Erythranthe guttata]